MTKIANDKRLPYANDHSGPAQSAISPVTGPPIGVEPKNATADKANKRPRISDGLCCWTSPLNDDKKIAPPIPNGTAPTNANQPDGAHATIGPETPNTTTLPKNNLSDASFREAEYNEPATLPILNTESTHPNQRSSPQRTALNFGNETE
jgi:hypothetical protein